MTLPTITGLDCGWMRTQRRTLLQDGGRDEIDLPVPAWLIRHPDGDVVFDTGLHPDAADPAYLGSLGKIFTVDLGPDGTVGPRLEQHDIDPKGNLTVVLSHGHFDHAGGLVDLPNARVLVQRDEWRAALSGEGYGIPVADHGHDLELLDGDHDVFGDGTILCVPTPGHTCGHQSLCVRTDAGTVYLASDACYFAHTIDDEVLPPIAHDRDAQLRSLAMLRRERDGGASIVPGHDAEVFAAMTR